MSYFLLKSFGTKFFVSFYQRQTGRFLFYLFEDSADYTTTVFKIMNLVYVCVYIRIESELFELFRFYIPVAEIIYYNFVFVFVFISFLLFLLMMYILFLCIS